MTERDAPQGHVGTPEAARLLGLSQQSIRNWLKSGKLKGMTDVLDESGTTRHYVEEESLREALASRGLPASREEIERAGQDIAANTDTRARELAEQIHQNRLERRQQHLEESELLKMIRDAIATQEAEVSERLDRMNAQQKVMAEGLVEAIRVMREASEQAQQQGERENEYQYEALELMRNYRTQINANRQSLERIEANRQPVDYTPWKLVTAGIVVLLIILVVIALIMLWHVVMG